MPFISEVTNETGERRFIQLGVHVVDDYGKVFTSLLFNLGERSQPERCSDRFRLPRTEFISGAPALGSQAQIMTVRTITGEAGLSVPRPRLIIPLLIENFHSFEVFGGAPPGLGTIVDRDWWKILSAQDF